MEQIEIYKKLKQLRKDRGLTLNTLAEKIGSDYQQLSRIERGKSKLSIDMLMKMANALETPVSDLVKEPVAEKKVLKLPSAVPDDFFQELLTSILEKIEGVIEETNRPLSPSLKASLASQIYKQVLKLYRDKQDVAAATQYIEFSVGLIKTLKEKE